MISADTSLELSAGDMRRLVAAALEHIVQHIESLPSQPAADTAGAVDLAHSLREDLPAAGQPIESLLEIIFRRAAPKSFNTAAPGYLAYIPGGGLFHSALADLIADTVNRFTGVWAAAPGLVQLETNVVRWLCQIMGYPAEAGGFLTTGGSLANFSAVVTARRALLPDDFLKGTIYLSDQAHHSVPRAAMLAGFPASGIRQVPTDGDFRIRVEELDRMVRRDRRAGLQPFLVVGNGGTTNTGAVDDLVALRELTSREGLWLHVDAAYGGFFMLTERGRAVLRGIDRADSVTLDPHKGMFLPYGTGSLVVRDREALRRAHAYAADYLPGIQSDPDLVDYYQISPELTRAFRGLRVWLPVKLHGIGVFQRNLDEKLDLAGWATEELRRVPGIEIVAEPQLSLVAFRLAAPGLSGAALDELNREFVRRINARNRIHLSGTVVREQFVARICVLSFRTHFDRMEQGLEDIRAAAAELFPAPA